MEQFFPNGIAHYVAGGLLLGAGIGLLYLTTGLVGGMSTVLSSTSSFFSRHAFFQQPHFTGSRVWRLVYAAGLIVGAFAWSVTLGRGGTDVGPTSVPIALLLVGGFVAGFGARMSNGCTAGHGICGMASLQLPSILAVITFLATAIATANLVRYWMG